MKHLLEYFNESLSSENVRKLSTYITDENIDAFLPKIEKIYKQLDLIGDHFKSYFTNKGLDSKSFDNNKDAQIGLKISSFFADEGKNDVLKEIVNNGGLIDFDTLYEKNNIFDICKDFRDSAKKISLIKDVTSNNANVGKFEILLKFILKENSSEGKKGDVVISYKNKPFAIEVKGGNKLTTSAHVCGQSTKSITEASKEFLKILNITSDDIAFLGSAKSNERLSKILNDNNITDIDNVIIPSYIKAFSFQYGVKPDKNIIDPITDKVIEYNNKNEIFKLVDNKIIVASLTDLIGLLQLYFYNQKENWDAICIINQINGDYVIFKNDDLLDFDKITNNIKFNYPEGNTDATGRRSISRVFPK